MWHLTILTNGTYFLEKMCLGSEPNLRERIALDLQTAFPIGKQPEGYGFLNSQKTQE